MTLDDYLTNEEISSSRFAKSVGVSIHAVAKWRQGRRIPRSIWIGKIKKLTKNRVSEPDWYNGKG